MEDSKNALDKIDVIENYASGVRRIFEDYADFKKQPEYYISDNGIIVTLFNRNYMLKTEAQNEGQNEGQNSKLDIQKRHELILEAIKENESTTAKDLGKTLGVSTATIERDIANLRKEGKLERIGSSKNGYWKIKE